MTFAIVRRARAAAILFASVVAVLCTTPAAAQLPPDVQACINERNAHSVDEKFAACNRVLQTRQRDPRYHATAYVNRGGVYLARRDYDRAIADYNEAFRMTPRFTAILYARGLAYAGKKDFTRALADTNEAIRRDPKVVQGYAYRGVVYGLMKDFPRAIEDFDTAIRMQPRYAQAYIYRSAAYERTMDRDRALADANEAIRLEPSSASAFNSRCWVRAIVGRELQEALADCNEALRLQPNDSNALDSRGFTHLKLGQFDKAIADYGAALQAAPFEPGVAYYGRGIARLLKGEIESGNADIAEAKKLKPDVVEDYARMGVLPPDPAAPTQQPPTAPEPAPVAATPQQAPGVSPECAQAETHWKSAEEIRTILIYEDHLVRFPSCNFAELARARIEALRK